MKITIELGFYTIKQCKSTYRTHFSMGDKENVTKSELALWFAHLLEGDLDSVHGDESEEEIED